jgi:hypothetical protein
VNACRVQVLRGYTASLSGLLVEKHRHYNLFCLPSSQQHCSLAQVQAKQQYAPHHCSASDSHQRCCCLHLLLLLPLTDLLQLRGQYILSCTASGENGCSGRSYAPQVQQDSCAGICCCVHPPGPSPLAPSPGAPSGKCSLSVTKVQRAKKQQHKAIG